MNVSFESVEQQQRARLRVDFEAVFGPSTLWRSPGQPDILMFAPTPERPHFLVMTCGLSLTEMEVPGCLPRFAEVVLTLDAQWPVADIHDPEAVWPLLLLGQVDRFVQAGRWIAAGHLIMLRGALPGTPYQHVVVSPTIEVPLSSVAAGGRDVALYALMPVLAEEFAWVQGRPLGGLALINRYLDLGLTERVTLSRPLALTPSEQVLRVLH